MTSPTRDVFQLELEKRGVVQAVTNDVTGGITKIWTGTQAQYDALTPADDTLYIIVEA